MSATNKELVETLNKTYCDVWRIHDGKVVSLRAFVIKTDRV